MKLSSYAKTLGIHYNTAYRLFKRGQIAGYQLPTGTVIVEESVDPTEHRALRPHYGRRRAKGKTAQVLAALQQHGEDA